MRYRRNRFRMVRLDSPRSTEKCLRDGSSLLISSHMASARALSPERKLTMTASGSLPSKANSHRLIRSFIAFRIYVTVREVYDSGGGVALTHRLWEYLRMLRRVGFFGALLAAAAI